MDEDEFISANLTSSSNIISPAFKIAYMVIIVTVMFIGVVGNSLVIYVVGRYSTMQTVTNIHLMSLSIADWVYLMSIPIVVTTLKLENFVFGDMGCKIFMISNGVNWFAGTYSLTAMSADRYLAVVHPMTSKGIRTARITTAIVVCIWLVSFVVMLPLMMYSSTVPMNPSNQTSLDNTTWACTIQWPVDQQVTAFTWYTFFLGFLIPVAGISVLYIMVIIRLQTVGPEKRSKERIDSLRRITRLVLAIVIIYIILWLPYWAYQLLLATQMVRADMYTAMLFQMVGFTNSAVNPILYAFMSQNFRAMFEHILVCHGTDKRGGANPQQLDPGSSQRRNGRQAGTTTTIAKLPAPANQHQNRLSHPNPHSNVNNNNAVAIRLQTYSPVEAADSKLIFQLSPQDTTSNFISLDDCNSPEKRLLFLHQKFQETEID